MFYQSSPHWSGSARVFVAAARGLAARGYQVTVVCPSHSVVESRAVADGCDIIPMDTGGSPLAAGWRLRHLLTGRFVETVFVHTESEHLTAAIAVRLAHRGGVVRRVPAGARPALGWRTRLALRLATGGFVFTSTEDATAQPNPSRARTPVIAPLGVEPARYEHVHSVLPQALRADVPRTRIVVCVLDQARQSWRAGVRAAGPFTPAHAGAETVLRTLALLAERHPELHIVIVSGESGHEDLRLHAAALGITGRVTTLGIGDDMLSVLKAAHIGWVIADEDAGAYAAMDFMAMQVPVLVARGAVGARYVADGITGVALAPGDASSAAAALAGLLAADARRASMGRAGAVRVAREYPESTMLDALQTAADAARDRTQW